MTSTPADTKRHLVADERGQGLVEYAMIIALVGLAAVIALGFLSGKINTIFSKTGNTLNAVAFADGGSPGTGSTGSSTTGGSTGGSTTGGSTTGGSTTGGSTTGGSTTGGSTTGGSTTGGSTTGGSTTGGSTTGGSTTGGSTTGGSTTGGSTGGSTTGGSTTGGSTGGSTTGGSTTGGSTGGSTTGGSTTGGSTGGGGTSTPPTNGGALSSNPGIVTSGVPGSAIWSGSISSSGFDPGAGVLSNSQPSSNTCSLSFNNGNTFTFSGTWVPDPPGFPEPIWDPSGSSTNYHWACVAVTPITPSSGQSFSQGKSFGDNLIDGGTYFPSLVGHSGASNSGAGVYATAGNGASSGTRAFYYTSSGVYICTWGADLSTSGSPAPHWNVNPLPHNSSEPSSARFNQVCLTSA